MTERELIVPLRQERELQRRVKELEEALKAFMQVTAHKDYWLDKDAQKVRCVAESLLSNSGAPQKETK